MITIVSLCLKFWFLMNYRDVKSGFFVKRGYIQTYHSRSNSMKTSSNTAALFIIGVFHFICHRFNPHLFQLHVRGFRSRVNDVLWQSICPRFLSTSLHAYIFDKKLWRLQSSILCKVDFWTHRSLDEIRSNISKVEHRNIINANNH